jgi:hypothetical protein
MPRQHHKREEIVAKLRQADVLVSQGQPPRCLRHCLDEQNSRHEQHQQTPQTPEYIALGTIHACILVPR